MSLPTAATTGVSVPEGYGIDFRDAAHVALDADCSFIEVLFDGRARPDRVEDALGPALTGTGLELVAHLPFTVPIWSPFEDHRTGALQTHEACLDAAAALDAKAAVVHPSSAAMGDAYDRSTVVDGVLESVRHLNAYGSERGVSVCVENLQSGPFTLDGLDRVVESTDASLVVDTGHARVSGQNHDELVEFVSEHRERVAHLHLNDTRGASDEHLPLGAGTVDFEGVFEALGRNWDGRLSVEFVGSGKANLARSLEHLDTILADP